jgi:hypothetical protein
MAGPTKTTLTLQTIASISNAAPITVTLTGVTDAATAKGLIQKIPEAGGVWMDPGVLSTSDTGSWLFSSAISTITYAIS